jgi:hypothetical protein
MLAALGLLMLGSAVTLVWLIHRLRPPEQTESPAPAQSEIEITRGAP